MARIRSIHPSLCTDEIYMGLSLPAKAAWPLMWMECDDQGVFEWKPIVLKARLFPADAIDMTAVLSELAEAGAVRQVEIDGKPCGLIKNFCKYQRPKKPLHRFVLTDEMRTFVAINVNSSVPVPNQSRTPTEKPPQREEEGGRKKKDIRTVAKATRPVDGDFQRFWKAYPKRKGGNPKSPAEKLFVAAVKSGTAPTQIIGAIEAKVGFDPDKIGTEYIPQAVKWLRDKRWEEFAVPDPKDQEERASWMAERGYVWLDGKWQKTEEVHEAA